MSTGGPGTVLFFCCGVGPFPLALPLGFPFPLDFEALAQVREQYG